MVIHVIKGVLSLVVGTPPHRKTTRVYAGDVIHVDDGVHIEVFADVDSSAEFRPGHFDTTKTARPISLGTKKEAESGPRGNT